MLFTAMPIYLISASWPMLVRVLTLVCAAVLGISLTMRVGGLPLYRRLLWHIQGVVWQHATPRLVVLEHLSGMVRRAPHHRPLPRNAPARIVRRTPQAVLAVSVRARAQRVPAPVLPVPVSVAVSVLGAHATPVEAE